MSLAGLAGAADAATLALGQAGGMLLDGAGYLLIVAVLGLPMLMAENSATVAALRAEELGDDWGAFAAERRASGWRDVEPGLRGGPDGVECVETAWGHALAGIDVLRACGDGAGRLTGVWRMSTHGMGWERVEAP